MPKSYRDRPQQPQRLGTATRSPRAVRAATRSVPAPGANASVKVSGQTTTELEAGDRSLSSFPACRTDLRRLPSRAKQGAGRFGARPPARFSAVLSPGQRRAALAARAATGDAVATRAAQGTRPMAYMAAGRSRPLVIVRVELRLVRGHVHVGRAVRGARLAGQAQVEGLPDLLVAPRGREGSPWNISVSTLARPRVEWTSSRGRPVGGAHGGRIVSPAAADTDAAQSRRAAAKPLSPSKE